MDPNVFEKIIEEESIKEVWEKLKNLYDNNEKLKRVKLQTLRKKFKMNLMKEEESLLEFFSCFMLLTNHMKLCGESITDLQKIEKVLRSMNANFDYIDVY